MQMDLKDYRIDPDEGLFENIQRRLARRRALRWGGVVTAVVLVAGGALWLSFDKAAPATQPVAQAIVRTNEAAMPVAVEATSAATPVAIAKASSTETPLSQPIAKTETDNLMPMQYASASMEASGHPSLPETSVRSVSQPLDDLILPEGNGNESVVVEDPNEPTSEVLAEATPSKSDNSHSFESIFTAPNVLLPQDGVAENRMFRLYASSSSQYDDFHLVIYNRGGRRVFSSTDITMAWDGTSAGQPVPQGTYIWIASFRDADGVLHHERGSVTVIR